MPIFRPDHLSEWEWLLQRFRAGYLEAGPNECWPWLKATVTDGYGTIALAAGVPYATHRLAYEIKNGPIPAGKCIRHICNNRPCCNPAHLVLGDSLDNIVDRVLTSNGKLTLEQVQAIQIDKRTQKIIAKEYKVSQSLISRIKSGNRWGPEIVSRIKAREEPVLIEKLVLADLYESPP